MALFKGTERVVFIDKRDFEGSLYEQIEEAYEFRYKLLIMIKEN